MSFSVAITLFFSLLVFAAVPGMGMFFVMSRAISFGLLHGAITVLGITLGDVFFIALALSGLSVVSEFLTEFSVAIYYLAGIYLIILGASFWRKTPRTDINKITNSKSSYIQSFVAGFMTTLSNPKVVLFYISFLPAFINLETLDLQQALLITMIAFLAVSLTMFLYAFLANYIKRYLASVKKQRIFNKTVACFIALTGVFLVLKGWQF